ncbi:DUF1906 domain-containing protein [Amycolatopsis sp., V23-08]|uniref:DUF1906 domain-containing protein n=1 Tax=Amycolatopsis heterodermiae TaxID=3110235 RepID=A0ABU5RLV7_9PSEU|nr:glycoside hydrolase domain-containing protein [Amycolatopsis sp., V23-08]MEA5366111.1 DUF1906 domain-containing protein [Amycolatopsis sp., V23-08]
MPTALDYSQGRPTGAAVKAAQHVGVVRYAGTPGRTKNITRAEYLDMDRQGVGVALVFEDAAGDALKGRPRGVTAAQAIVADAAAVGFPASRPLYFAVDQDITGQMGTVLEYFRGIGSVLGGRPAGVYGEADVLDAVLDAGLARFGWQTVAWSRGRTAKTRHLYQRAGQIYVGGIQVDVNDVLAADWGQHNAQEEDVAFDQKDLEFLLAGSVKAPDGKWYYVRDVLGAIAPMAGQVAQLTSSVAGLTAAVAALSAEPDLTVDQVKTIVTDAVKQNIQITGEVHIGPAAAADSQQ